MKLDTIPDEFTKAERVLREIQAQGFEAYFVGGSVRDALLNQPIHDVDIATSAYPEEIKEIFHRTVDVGIDHGTVLVLIGEEQYEITTFRTESTYQDFRRPDTVTFVRSLKEDLKRRDFTINALAMNVDGEIIDLFDGINDLEHQIIRAVGNPRERFHEDALRMMRGLRFASQLDFSIEPETLSAIEDFHSLLDKISVERIAVEFIKLLLGKNRRAALRPFIETECYQYCPELRGKGAMLFDFAELPNKQIESESQAWALLIKTIGLKENAIRSFLKSWKQSNQMIYEVQQLVYGLNQRLLGDWEVIDLFNLGLDAVLSVEKLLFYYEQKSKLEEAKERYLSLPIHNRKELAITGNDVLAYFDKTPGKWVGEMIEMIETAVVNRQIINNKKVLLAFAKDMIDKE
ncbi:CCA tRNA nucleotidyltransferase [Enterococcus ureilyticus]|uniref:CCA-adding enzyme n=1 Tax=Enterococcus ureilyticus TaxID=1131292 RepID=A0A1E5H8N6_9ENTE|nr:CCA tRNA nucleotidyltransferase [Enterococcus ureilyticus]MBM7688673.1 tRNA nucleotidyltransferase (CCA-adding enzyme) [Enterococcus ureilyticus]MBO0447095.1 CCA tRNA nucleotidyltransferase [Enterococcus ureilyticus]OEG21195.1 CCA tRNA nucleotidyltransferase [Enterococcus ureilyticus]